MLQRLSLGLGLGLGPAMPRQIPSRALHTRFFSPSFPSLPSLPSLPSSSLPSRSVISTTRQAWMAIPSSPRFFSGTRIPTVQSSIAKRAFSTSRAGWVRQTYFPRSGGSGGSGGDGRSWFSNMRRRIDALPTMVVIYGLIGANVSIFLLWQYATTSWQRFRDPSLYQWMTKNFVLNEYNMMAGRIWTLLTACFSHSSGTHIFMNCLGLYFIAPAVASLIGSTAFLGLYMGGGIFASLVSLGWHRMRGDKWSGSEGASGAIYASLAFYGALFPNTTFLLFFVLPLPAWAMIGGIFAYDAYSAIFRPSSGTDSAGHMGGIAAGLGAALYLRRRGLRGIRRW